MRIGPAFDPTAFEHALYHGAQRGLAHIEYGCQSCLRQAGLANQIGCYAPLRLCQVDPPRATIDSSPQDASYVLHQEPEVPMKGVVRIALHFVVELPQAGPGGRAFQLVAERNKLKRIVFDC